MASVAIPADFGYVVLVIVLSFFVLAWLGINVGRARSKYGVKYPAMYSDKDPVFNCYQRAHQNTLEGYPLFVVLLLLGGLQYPYLCSGAGAVWLMSRILYASGYYSGDPNGRKPGAGLSLLSLLILLGSCAAFGLKVLGY